MTEIRSPQLLSTSHPTQTNKFKRNPKHDTLLIQHSHLNTTPKRLISRNIRLLRMRCFLRRRQTVARIRWRAALIINKIKR